jgi:hypothetical protein
MVVPDTTVIVAPALITAPTQAKAAIGLLFRLRAEKLHKSSRINPLPHQRSTRRSRQTTHLQPITHFDTSSLVYM